MTSMLANLALTVTMAVPTGIASAAPEPARFRRASIERIAAIAEPSFARKAASQSRGRLTWLPWAGAAVGGTLAGIGVAGEEDIVATGKVLWIAIGAAGGAAAGWLIAKLSGA